MPKKFDDDAQESLPKRWVGCPIEVDYFGDDRKGNKAARKLASSKDRSQYKKTDRRQQAKQSKEQPPENMERGRVLCINSQGIIVHSEAHQQTFVCALRGLLKKEKTQAKNLVTVGDFVLFALTAVGEGVIYHVEPRKSFLSRAENLSRRKEQLIAANIDQVMITISVVSPALKAPLIDRYIIAAQKGNMMPILVINKIDLFHSAEVDAEFLANEQSVYTELLRAYSQAGIQVIPISTVSGEGLADLKKVMQDKASVFAGQSGVGKSSLINAITDSGLRTGDLVEKTNKGTHTTTTAQLLPLEFGGWCIDTPGIKSFGIWDLDKEEVEQYFTEIFETGHQCKYPDCSHLSEDNCAVVKAVVAGEISPLRYGSYQALMDSINDGPTRR